MLSSTKCQESENMFINKSKTGRNNICGVNVCVFRKEMRISQRKLADKLQIIGLDIDKHAIQRIDSGQRFVTDIELIALARALERSIDDLLAE